MLGFDDSGDDNHELFYGSYCKELRNSSRTFDEQQQQKNMFERRSNG